MRKYDHKKIEEKWREIWEKEGTYSTKEKTGKKKFYVLDMFPYPSGEGLHVGHPKGYIATDIYSRWKRMNGFNVLHPMGFDAFGLPAENYALKNKVHPRVAVEKNIKRYKKQLSILGFDYDWGREINTTDPEYYKWTQWIFLQLFKKGLAYESYEPINWCPSCKTGLANEDLEDGRCERCGSLVEKKPIRQWVLKIREYADRILHGLKDLDWSDSIKELQRNWIGRSEGAEIYFKLIVPGQPDIHKVKVFTTRPDTIFGATLLAVSPELAKKWLNLGWKADKKAVKYIDGALALRLSGKEGEKEKTGVEAGIKAVNPATGEEIPVWITDYVLSDVGTGAIMAVPAHDDRDWRFAKKFGLAVREVVIPERIDKRNPPVPGKKKVERRNIHVIVRNPKGGKTLILKWKKHPWTTFPMGGVEDGEDIVEAARREVLEETGYCDLSEGKVLGGQVRAEYFAAHKDENRVSFTSLVVFDLKSEKKKPVSKEEEESFDIFWAETKELTPVFMTHAEMDVWLERLEKGESAYAGEGVLINSGKFTGLSSAEAREKITKFVGGKSAVSYKLRDWVFSRQRYWGEPIPIIHCQKCGHVPVPEKDLPVRLPEVKSYEPTGTGESPLSAVSEWVNVKCPKCGGGGKRETNTMPQWAGSSWYWLRYMDPKNAKKLVDKKKEKYWSPVDLYVGGAEHATRHLIYARFWHKFLFDIGVVNYEEPFKRLQSVGLIMGEDGRKMSKRFGNVLNPDDIVERLGADTLRLYEMFMGPFDQPISWSTDSMAGMRRFLERVWRLAGKIDGKENLFKEGEIMANQSVKKVSEDIEAMKFNTALSQLMIFLNSLEKQEKVPKKLFETFLKLLSVFAPHISEELWRDSGHTRSVFAERWPKWDKKKISSGKKIIVVQINGKKRGEFETEGEISEDEVRKKALSQESVKKWLSGKEIKKFVYVPGRLVSFYA